MADFQTTVNIYPAIGVEGAFASINPIISTPLGKIAGTELFIGGFCWDDPDNVGQVVNNGTGKPLGFVARNMIYPINELDVNASNADNVVPVGFNVNVMLQGDFYAVAPEEVTAGKKVFASTTDGSIKVGDAGGSVDGAVETDWTFASAGSEGDVVVISNYGQGATSSGE